MGRTTEPNPSLGGFADSNSPILEFRKTTRR